ncbi:DNA-binding response regulator [Lachnospiraceae bacterium]|jgi:DNA-binding LytR/AlgR family response regulator|nr:DNA-binding response regulator [Lachnospiraceae bacterium]
MHIDGVKNCKHIYLSKGLASFSCGIKIAICDNNWQLSRQLNSKIRKILVEEKIKGEIYEYMKTDQLRKNEILYDILFLSMDMFESDVMQAVRELRNKYSYSKLILVSEDAKYLQEAYKAQPFRYLLRTDQIEEIREAIDSAIEENKEKMGFVLDENGRLYPVLMKEILYMESLGDDVLIATENKEKFIVRMTLKKMYNMLEYDFIRCSREYIVNIRHIKKIGDRDIILDNGYNITISFRNMKSVKERYREYVFRSNQML